MILPFLAGGGASVATLLGGLLALRFRGRMSLLLALSTGIVLGISILDLAPEALKLADGIWPIKSIAAFTAVGFALYILLSRSPATSGQAGWQAHLAPAMLATHSLIDGIGIGLAYRIDVAAGTLVSAAVLAHDIADGANIVTLGLLAGDVRAARTWLALDCLAPVIGVLLGLNIAFGPAAFSPMLAVMAGGLLYIGASEMLPRLQASNPRGRTAVAILSGMAFTYFVTKS